jgi:excisionase family DNA binding protein
MDRTPARAKQHATYNHQAMQARDTPPTCPEPRLLTVVEVGRWLRTSRSWVYAAVRAERLPYVRVGGDAGPIRFIEADIRAHIRAGYVEPSGSAEPYGYS